MTIRLTEIFKLQEELDERIILEKNLDRNDNLRWRITAFIVELGEFANEARWFKKWSGDQNPRTTDGHGNNPLLEEFVDALHFAVSIGIELGVYDFKLGDREMYREDPNELFATCASRAASLATVDETQNFGRYSSMMSALFKLGWYFGITDKQIMEAYRKKNAVNHERQANGY